MFSKSLLLAAGLLFASAAYSLPSRPVPGDPAIIPLPSALDVEKNKPGFLVSNTLPVSKTGDKSCIASFVTGFSNNLRQIKVSPAPSAANAVQILLKKDASLSPEWYSIKVSTQGIAVSCTSPAGAFYAGADPQAVSGKGCRRPLGPSLHDHHGQSALHVARHHD